MELKMNEFFDMGNSFEFDKSLSMLGNSYRNPFELVFDTEVDYVTWVLAQIDSNQHLRGMIGCVEGEKYEAWVDDVDDSDSWKYDPKATFTLVIHIEGTTYDNKPYFRDVKLKHVMNLNVCKNMIESMKEQE